MTRDTENLVRDLLSLYVKYGAETFAEATEALSRGAVSREIADGAKELFRVAGDLPQTSLASKTKQQASKYGRSKKPRPKEAAQKYIAELLGSHKHSDVSVGSFLQEIADRIVLNSPSLLKNYIDLLRLPPTPATADRYALIRRIGEHLLGLSTQEAEERINVGRNMISPKSSLEAWANVIVRPESQR